METERRHQPELDAEASRRYLDGRGRDPVCRETGAQSVGGVCPVHKGDRCLTAPTPTHLDPDAVTRVRSILEADDVPSNQAESLARRILTDRPYLAGPASPVQAQWYRCGVGHIFQWGNEGWHTEHSQPNGAPAHCPVTVENGESCMESSGLFGPFPTAEAASPVQATDPPCLDCGRPASEHTEHMTPPCSGVQATEGEK